MLLRVAPDLSELVVCAEQAEQENILGARQESPSGSRWDPASARVLLTDTARRLAARTRPARRRPFLCASYQRTVSHDGTSVSWSPTQYPKVWRPNIDTMPRG